MSIFSSKVIYWSKVLSKFVSVQIIVQTLGFICSILVIRTLDKQQYAYYTIANSMQASMNVLSDSGISISLSAIGGKVCKERYRFGQLVNTALQLRKYFAIIVVAVTVPILLWMLVTNGASIVDTITITIAVLLSVNSLLILTVYGMVLRLHYRVRQIQNLDLLSAVSRLVILSAAYLTFMNASVAILAASIPLFFNRLIINRWITNSIDIKAPANKQDREAILEITKQRLPNDIFSSVQGQLTIWLISIFGNASNIAEIGAIGRLAALLNVFNTTLNAAVLPRFSRCQVPRVLYRRYWQIIAITCLMSFTIIGGTFVFLDRIIWILGEQYIEVKDELLLMTLSISVSTINMTMKSINSSKAWIKNCWLLTPTTLVVQAILLIFLNVSTVNGVIIFGILSQIPYFFLNIYMTYDGFKSIRC